jgi:hypothetical protein
MDQQPTPTDPLLKAAHCQLVHTLRGALPQSQTDSPEDAARRDLAAIIHIASLRPANPDEANLAVQFVAAGAQALECQRLANEHVDDPTLFLKFTARSNSFLREARSWRTLLLTAQAARHTRETDPASQQTATETEHRALGLLAEALAQTPPAQPQSTPPDPIAEAEQYAQNHRKRAALIRKLRRLPRHINVGYIRPAVLDAIINGTTPALQALDEKPHRPTATAA